MIDLYFWPTPNGYKITWMLEEVGLKYNVIPVNIGAGDQFKPEFLKISPNNRMPAIIDPDGPGGKPISMFESGAILMYLAEKTGKLMPSDTRGKYNVIQWLMFQMASVGPMLGQAHHFRRYAPEKLEYAINRYTNEAKRIYGVIDKRLGEAKYLAGEYSIADIATYPWLVPHSMQGQALEDFPNLKKWYDELRARPATQRGFEVMGDGGREDARGSGCGAGQTAAGSEVVGDTVRQQAVREALDRLGRAVEQSQQCVHGFDCGHAEVVAAGGADYGAAQRFVFEGFAAFEVLLSRGFERAQVLLRMRDVGVDAVVGNPGALGARDVDDLLHQCAQQFQAFGIVEYFADAPARQRRHRVDGAVPDELVPSRGHDVRGDLA